MGGLARRISRWTTNSLLTLMLLVIALGFGRQVLHWWHDDSTPRGTANANSPASSVGAADSQILAFGEQNWSIRRQDFNGPAGAVPAALVQFCRSVIVDAPPRGDMADAAEQDVLKRLATEKPIAEEPGKWRLYQWSEGVPIVIGTRNVSGTLRVPMEGGTRSVPDTKRTILAEKPCRVVIWSMAVPADKNSWTLYIFQAGGKGPSSGQGVVEVPLPPGGRRLASVGSGGGSITAFSADDGLTDAIPRFYDRWFGQRGWVAAAPWQHTSTGWQARFESAAGGATIAVDIRLGGDPQGRCTGLVMESQVEGNR